MGGSVPELSEIGPKAEGPLLEEFRREVAHMLGRPNNTNFPGAQPVSFARHHIEELKRRDYYVCEKSDGIRCLLYFTSDPQLGEIHYLIDRKNNYYFVSDLHFPLPSDDPSREPDWTSYHTNTILDGELLWDIYPDGKRILKYLVFDTLILDGQTLMHRPLDKRTAYFMERIYKPYRQLRKKFPVECSRHRFVVEEKKFQLGYASEMMFRQILPELPHGNDGLIFTCKDTPYQPGTDQNILKWKPAEENSIDFKLEMTFPPMPSNKERDTGDEQWEYDFDAIPKCTLHAHYDRNDDRPWGEMYATQEDWNKMKQWAIEHNDGLDGQIVECHQDSEGRWRFMRFRDDKSDGNHISTVNSVVESIRDSVSKQELIESALSVKHHWKMRAAEEQRRADEQRRPQQDLRQQEARRRQMMQEQHQGSGRRMKSESREPSARVEDE